MWHTSTRHDDEALARGVLRQALLLGSAGALLWNSWRCVQRTRLLRREGKGRRTPEPLQTWEGEGGRPVTPAGSAPLQPPGGM